jgi:carbon-monoxide dehydrogenase medium subunit
MFSANFEYHVPGTVDEAIGLLERYPDDAKLLAGGHSLIPVMKLRFAQPGHLIDLRRVPGLVGIRAENGTVVIGSMTTYNAVQNSSDVRGKIPVLAEAAALVGDPQVRNRGTIGGSLAHADPGGDIPAVALALDAEIAVRGKGGGRTIQATDFFLDLLSTSLTPGEVITQIRFHVPPGTSGEAYEKFKHPASGYAVVGVAAVVTLGANGTIERTRIGLTGVANRAQRARAVEEALTGQLANDATIAAAAKLATQDIAVREEAQWPASYRAQLAITCTARAVTRAVGRARET